MGGSTAIQAQELKQFYSEFLFLFVFSYYSYMLYEIREAVLENPLPDTSFSVLNLIF